MIRKSEPTNEELVTRYQAGDPDALGLLLAKNQGICWEYSRRMFTSDQDIEDAVQTGNECLIDCARNFRPELGWRFSTYAVRSVWLRLCRLRNKNRMITLPYSYRGPWDTIPQWLSEEEESLLHIHSQDRAPDDVVAENDELAVLRRLLYARISCLKPRSQLVIVRRIRGMTLEAIGAEMGVSKERVRQMYETAVSQMQVVQPTILGGWSSRNRVRKSPTPRNRHVPEQSRPESGSRQQGARTVSRGPEQPAG